MIEAGVAREGAIFRLAVTSDRHNHRAGTAGQLAQLSSDCVAIQAGESDVQQHYIRQELFRLAQRLHSVRSRAHVMATLLDEQGERLARVVVVLDDENASSTDGRSFGLASHRFGRHWSL